VKAKWSPWVGGGFVREGAEDAVSAAWEKWVRACERFAGCLPCPGADFPGPFAAMADVVQVVSLSEAFAAEARRARLDLGRNCRGK
jgi:hypothetical protein